MAAMMEAKPMTKPTSSQILAILAPDSDELSSEIYAQGRKKQTKGVSHFSRNLPWFFCLTCSPLTAFTMQKLMVPNIPMKTCPVVIWCLPSIDMASIRIHHPAKNCGGEKNLHCQREGNCKARGRFSHQ